MADGRNRIAPQPMWIEAPVGPIFAWHHAPCDEGRDAGVVLCKPFGFEAACCHRAYRHLAGRLAEQGFHVLRLDYHGTGDSSGGDGDPDRVDAWIDSTRTAAQWLCAHAGTDKVALFGTRFGALVALEVAAREPVDALVLFAPPRSGRAWLREIRAFQLLRAGLGHKRLPIPGRGEEAIGFLLAGHTVDAFSKLDPLGQQTAKHALVIARDDLPGGEEGIAAQLESHGAEVTVSRAPGYAAMMQDDAHKSIVPDAAWSEISAWLAERFNTTSAARGAPSYAHAAMVREVRDSPMVREEAVNIGGLFGVLAEPIDSSAASGRPAIVLHSIGANPHVGTNRMYVTMARRWAALGFRVFRFDLSGIGDSPPREGEPENRVYSRYSIDDSQRAMDFLVAARNVPSFVLVGLCSGAHVSFRTAVADARVTGVVLMNILTFHWKEGDSLDVRIGRTLKSSRFYGQALLEREVWLRAFKGQIHITAIVRGLVMTAWARVRRRVVDALAGESEVAQGFRAILRRGANVLLVFAAEDAGRDLIDEHLGIDGAKFRKERRFSLEIVQETDHTFTPLWSQEFVYHLLTNYFLRWFPPDGVRHEALADERTA